MRKGKSSCSDYPGEEREKKRAKRPRSLLKKGLSREGKGTKRRGGFLGKNGKGPL